MHWCPYCAQTMPCTCGYATDDVDTWCASQLGSVQLEAEYQRRERRAQVLLKRVALEGEASSVPARRWCPVCLAEAPLSAGGLCVLCDLHAQTREDGL